MGMGIVPDERRRLGLNMLFDIKDNTTLPNLDQFRRLGIFQDLEAEARAAFDVNEKMNLKYYSLWQDGEEALRRQPAKGGHRQVDAARLRHLPAGRADARHRHRREV